MIKVNFQVRNIKLDEITKEKIQSKLEKYSELLKKYQFITCKVNTISQKTPNPNFFKIEITVKMPKAFIKVENTGDNINNIIDTLMPPLHSRLVRYSSQYAKWEKQKTWKDIKLEEATKVDDIDEETIDINFEPQIKRKFYDDDTPMHPAEAVEQMELLGHNSYLFKNIENNKYAMIYRREKGGYGLVEPR